MLSTTCSTSSSSTSLALARPVLSGGAYSQGCPANCDCYCVSSVTRTANSQGCPANCVTRSDVRLFRRAALRIVLHVRLIRRAALRIVLHVRPAYSQGCPANCVTRTANSQGWSRKVLKLIKESNSFPSIMHVHY